MILNPHTEILNGNHSQGFVTNSYITTSEWIILLCGTVWFTNSQASKRNSRNSSHNHSLASPPGHSEEIQGSALNFRRNCRGVTIFVFSKFRITSKSLSPVIK